MKKEDKGLNNEILENKIENQEDGKINTDMLLILLSFIALMMVGYVLLPYLNLF